MNESTITSTTMNKIPTTESRKKIKARAVEGDREVGTVGRTPGSATERDGARAFGGPE